MSAPRRVQETVDNSSALKARSRRSAAASRGEHEGGLCTVYPQLCTHGRLRSVAIFDILILRRRQLKATEELAGEAYIRAQRLEIRLQALEMRLSALEELHKGLDYTVRGRLGGRPRKEQQPSTPVPLGALHILPPKE